MIFAINTSTTQFSLALLNEEGDIVSEYIISAPNKNFAALMPAIQSIFEASNIRYKNLKALTVVVGPGSFTGLRVGLSTAKGFAQALKLPLIGVSGLEAMANQLPFTQKNICPIIDSRKGEIFYALFRLGENHRILRILEDSCARTNELPQKIINKGTVFIGNNFHDQSRMIREAFSDDVLLAPSYLWGLRASAVGLLGLKKYHKKKFDNLRDLVPFYIRSPDIRKNPYPFFNRDPFQ
ncbi:MAG: tRNA (adenosine(37)-N6)-threonylcarbamoyltransferase complex dimerization subunit type 1 TsaB [Deltaproteobacteria bacterium]|nr:tRNA (adenosine(37)-N6)-threonylcarbamoyltransferase complex dimerization subunit type 1 TsaB [Deltaproteobacteria bacterium]